MKQIRLLFTLLSLSSISAFAQNQADWDRHAMVQAQRAQAEAMQQQAYIQQQQLDLQNRQYQQQMYQQRQQRYQQQQQDAYNAGAAFGNSFINAFNAARNQQ